MQTAKPLFGHITKLNCLWFLELPFKFLWLHNMYIGLTLQYWRCFDKCSIQAKQRSKNRRNSSSTTNEKLFKNFERLLSDNYLSGTDVRLNFSLILYWKMKSSFFRPTLKFLLVIFSYSFWNENVLPTECTLFYLW